MAVPLALAAFFAITGSAAAVTNTVAYSVDIAMGSEPSQASPANTGFRWTYKADTDPAGMQPDTAPAFRIFFPGALSLNAQDFPVCSAAQIDGQSAFPADCANAALGSGTATLYAGSPGSPRANSVKEDLTVRAVNGAPAGKALLLVVTSAPGAPISIMNRVLPGTLVPADAPFGFTFDFTVPTDLQNQLGLAIALTDMSVTISGTPRAITVGSVTTNESYLQAHECSGSLPVREVTQFKSGSAPAAPVTTDAVTQCAGGSFPDPPDFPTGPYTSPRIPAPGPQPPAPGAEPRIEVTRSGPVVLAQVHADRHGAFPLRGVVVTCPAGAAGVCDVTGRGAARAHGLALASLRYRVAAGATSGLRMRLTPAGRSLLSKRKKVSMRIALTLTQSGAHTAAKTLHVTVKP
jgi:hypothetical protein